MVALRKPPELSLGTTACLVVLMLGVCAVLGYATRKSFTITIANKPSWTRFPAPFSRSLRRCWHTPTTPRRLTRPRLSSLRCAEAGECTPTSLFFANLR